MMSQPSRRVIAATVADYDSSSVSRVLDVGGGLGHFVAAVLTAYPALHGAVFDVPEVVDLARANVADRCVAVGGDFFESLPAGFDVHLLKWILRDWNDDSCRKLLKVCRAAPGHGRLLVVEWLLSKEISTSFPLNPAIAMDLGMLVNFGDARERYLDEYEELLGSCRFAVHEMIGLPSGFSVLDCRRESFERCAHGVRLWNTPERVLSTLWRELSSRFRCRPRCSVRTLGTGLRHCSSVCELGATAVPTRQRGFRRVCAEHCAMIAHPGLGRLPGRRCRRARCGRAAHRHRMRSAGKHP
jgi:hypothetical protein